MTADGPLRAALQQLAAGQSLSAEATAEAFETVAAGCATPVQTAALLMGLRTKGETPDEVAGAARALRSAMIRLDLPTFVDGALVDTCGTGGGRIPTFNVSTAAAFVAAGAGIRVPKHGNRSYTSRCGSADVFEALGVAIALDAVCAAEVLARAGLVFLFAPAYHPAMRHFGPTRKELGVPTIMNLIGPLASPAAVTRQVVGVADGARAPLMADALARLGAAHALVVHAAVGMDEISPSGATYVWEVAGGGVRTWRLDPSTYDLACDDLHRLEGGEPAENAARIERLLGEGGGEHDDRVGRCTTLLNAAAALYVSGNGWSFDESVDRATRALDSGAALAVLRRLQEAAPLSTSG